jgi:porphobilinogen synthase
MAGRIKSCAAWNLRADLALSDKGNPMRPIQALYPAARFRRLRRSDALRRLAQENVLSVNDLIWPMFVCDGNDVCDPVASMPGVNRRSIDGIVAQAEQAAALGIPAICLFPYTDPDLRTETCEEAWNPENLANRAIRAIKAAVPDIAVMTDIALDPYNANGHDGLVRDGIILNDETVEALVRMALAQAEAGADILGPSDMMDGRIGAMRQSLEAAGYPFLCCEICVGFLWSVPRCGRGRQPSSGRQENLSDEPRQFR